MKFGRYTILKELGKGSMGVVYQARDPDIDRLIALKVLRSDRVTSEDFVARFLKEAKAIGRLSHPGIVTVHDLGSDQETIFIAMEYLEGKPLNEIIQGNKPTLNEIVNIGVQVAEALDYAHRNRVVHRDVKPSNIIVSADGRVKLTDFGIARIEDPFADRLTHHGEILGTPAYMSPEQVEGSGADGRSDLFSLGVILYELTTGERPFKGDTLTNVFASITQAVPVEPCRTDPTISSRLSAVIMKSLSKGPDERFQTGQDMARALRLCLSEGDLQGKFVQKKTKLLGALLLALILSTGAFWFYHKQPTPVPSPVLSPAVVPDLVSSPEKRARLSVQSNPAGAQVFLNNSLKGATPIDLELPFGKYEIRLSLRDYYEWEAQLQLDREGETPLRVTMVPTEK